LDAALQPGSSQPLRGGIGVDVALAIADPTIGTFTADPVHFAGGDNTHTTAFHPIAGGTTTISVQPPAGFTMPSIESSISAAVTAPEFSVPSVTVGQNLQASEVVSLGAPAPAGGVPVTIASADPTRLLVSSTATGAGSASIVITAAEGTTATPAFFVQALSD